MKPSFKVPGFFILSINTTPNDWGHAYGTIVHELGHYKFGLDEEYRDELGKRKTYCRSTVRHGSIMSLQFHHWIAPFGTSEFCTPFGPNSHHDPRDSSTWQPAYTAHDAKWSWISYRTSCWVVINLYNNAIKIPTGDPDPGPCSKSNNPNSNDSHEPLEAHQGTAQFVVLIGP